MAQPPVVPNPLAPKPIAPPPPATGNQTTPSSQYIGSTQIPAGTNQQSGNLQYGATDPTTGQRQELFTPGAITSQTAEAEQSRLGKALYPQPGQPGQAGQGNIDSAALYRSTLDPTVQQKLSDLESQLGGKLSLDQLQQYGDQFSSQNTADAEAKKSQDILNQQRGLQEQGINSDYANKIAEESRVQNDEDNQQKVQLARMGALFTTTSANEVIRDKIDNNRQAIQSLESERDMLLNQARSAYASNKIGIASKAFADAQALNQQATDKRRQIAQDQRQALQDEQTAAQNKFKTQQDQAAQQDQQAGEVAGSLVSVDAQGNVVQPSEEDIQKAAEQYGIEPYQLKNAVNSQYQTLSSSSVDERLKQSETQKNLGVGGAGTANGQLEFHAATKYSPAGYFNKSTGVFTPLGKGGPGGGGTTSSGSGGGTGTGGAGGRTSPINLSATGGGLGKPTTPLEVGEAVQRAAEAAARGEKVIDELPIEIPPGKDVGGYSKESIDQMALDAANGSPPRIGTSKAVQPVLEAIARRRALLFPGSASAGKYEQKAQGAALTEQTKYANDVERSVKSADQNFKNLLSAFKDSGINTSDSAILNKSVNQLKRNLSGGKLKAFESGLSDLSSEYAQVFSRGGSVTESSRAKAESILDVNLSFGQLMEIQKVLQSQGNVVIQNAKSQVQIIEDQLNGKTSGGSSGSGGGDVENYKNKYGIDY